MLSTPLKAPRKSPVMHAHSDEAKDHNAKLLSKFNYNITGLIADCPNMEIGYGNEFRPAHLLKKLLYLCHNWSRIEDFLQNGFYEKFKPISDEQRIKDNVKAIKRGNHKSALDNIEMLRASVVKEIGLGFQFVFDKSITNKIPGSVVAPCGGALQPTIDD